uniref:Uncharacterized protein n=1 Tax=viral metagenome TaxID=1070528 RepID=A0A6C0HLQ1_9ZZZZ
MTYTQKLFGPTKNNIGKLLISTLLLVLIAYIIISIYQSGNMNFFGNTKNTKNTKDTKNIKDKFDNVTDSTADITNRLQPLQTYLAKYTNLNIPISFDDVGNLCKPWGIFENSKYIANDNVCIKVDNTMPRKCLTTSGNVLTPCSKIYEDGQLNSANTIAASDIYNIAMNNMTSGYTTLNNAIETANTNLDIMITNAGQYTDLTNSQNTLINNNMVGLTDKKQNYNDNLDILQNKMDKTNIAHINYQQFLQTKANTDARISLYKKIVIALIIILFVLCGLIYVMSNIL